MKALRLFLWLFFLTAFVYPLTLTLLATLLFPKSSRGDILYIEGKPVGAKLIGQKFETPKYFHSRPSASDYSALPSAASNLGPISKTLKEEVDKANKSTPSDLIFKSGSGLDPHITIRSALYQVSRIASARKLDTKIIADLIQKNGEYGSYVNVLLLNLKLDEL